MNITSERFEEIEQERTETMNDPNYIKWVKELKVSQLYIDPSYKFKARELMSNYTFTDKFFK